MIINLLVIVMFVHFRKKLLSVNNNKFLFSMALADFLVGLFGILGSILFYLYQNGWLAEEIWKLCGSLPFFGSLLMSILSLSILTVDRLIAVVCALRYHSIMTEIRANLLVCITWIAVTLILVIQGSIYLGISSALELTIRTYQLVGFFIVGAFALGIANAKLHCIIRSKRKSLLNSGTGDSKPSVDAKATGSFKKLSLRPAQLQKNMARVFSDSRVCFWMTTIFVICWLPITAAYVAHINGYLNDTISYTICMSIANSNSLLNPLIYLIKRRDFRRRFNQLFVRCKRNGETKAHCNGLSLLSSADQEFFTENDTML